MQGTMPFGRHIWVALLLLPLAVVLAGFGFPFDPTLDFSVASTNYHLVVLGVLGVIYAIFLRVSDSLASRAAQKIQALQDPLTGLPNAELFADRLQQAILISERDGSLVPVVMIGIDRFEELRTGLGREVCDETIKSLADRLQQLLRDSDTLARTSESVFAVLLPSAQDTAGAMIVVKKLTHGLHEAFQVGDVKVEVQATFGVAASPEHGRDAAAVMRNAGVALAWARENGSRVELYSPEHDAVSEDRIALVAELRHAIENDQLVLFYQPKSSFSDGKIHGVEALVRWVHPERGFVPPDAFIPLAEETDLMRPLTLYVLEEAFKQVGEWRLRGIEICVAVNISARNLLDAELPNDIASLMEKWSVDPSWIELEVTETTVMNDQSRSAAVLQTLSDMGLRLSIDDYGTGYTSLEYLRRLPVDGLKIDRLFVQNLNDEAKDEIIVRSTIELGRGLGLDIVAEGVETQEVWDKLQELGCDLAQGYFLSRPLPPAELSFN